MPWYYVYDSASGDLLSSGSVLGETVPGNPALGYISTETPVNQAAMEWSSIGRGFVPRPASVRYTLSQLEFTRRFTLTEDATLEAMALSDTTPLTVRAQINTLNKRISRATMIDLRDPDTITGVEIAMQLLQMAGLLDETTAAARQQEILTPANDA